MSSETLSHAQNPNFVLNPSHHHSLPSKTPSFLALPSNPPFPLFKNPILSPRSPQSPTHIPKATTINAEIALPETHPNSTFYELLGIPTSGSVVEIKQAYKQLARKYHPDVSPPDRAEEYTKRFILVQKAYETLSDPNMRALYDMDMSRGLHLAFSGRKGFDEGLMQKNEWRNQWQNQVDGLKNKRATKNSNMSWAAQMRQRRFESDGVD